MINSDVQRQNVPTVPGVYVFKTPGAQILYIGKAKNLKKRLQHYFTPSSVWKQDMVAKAKTIERFPVTNEQEALMLEHQLLQTHQPPFNNLIRGDSSYFYLKLNREPFPRIELTRYKKNDRADYFGPKLWKRDLKQLLQLLRHIFQWRSCGTKQFTQGVVCSDYFFGLCAGWCTYKQTAASQEANRRLGVQIKVDQAEAELRYTAFRSLLKAFFNGNTKPIALYLEQEMGVAVAQQHFERAAKLRDMYTMIDALSEQQHIVLDQPKTGIFAWAIDRRHHWSLVVIRLFGGKIVDVITTTERQDDTDIDDLQVLLTQTFGYPLTRTAVEGGWQLFGFHEKTVAKRHLVQLAEHAQRFLEAQHIRLAEQPETDTAALLQTLQSTYGLPKLPQHIETLDISHMSGQHTVGGLVCFLNGSKHTAGFRRYRIRNAKAGDDYAALREVLITRLGLEKPRSPALPDLLIIDGGKGQLAIITRLAKAFPRMQAVLAQCTIMSIGKGKARKRAGKQAGHHELVLVLRPNGTVDTYPLGITPDAQLLTRMRDEAHRYANSYRKIRKRAEMTTLTTDKK